MIGCGAVGQGSLPLLFRHLGLRPDQLSVVSADDDGRDVAQAHGVAFEVLPLHRDNIVAVLQSRLGPGDFLVNASLKLSTISNAIQVRLEGTNWLPADTKLWALLQNASGGVWGGCVYDVDAIEKRLANGV